MMPNSINVCHQSNKNIECSTFPSKSSTRYDKSLISPHGRGKSFPMLISQIFLFDLCPSWSLWSLQWFTFSSQSSQWKASRSTFTVNKPSLTWSKKKIDYLFPFYYSFIVTWINFINTNRESECRFQSRLPNFTFICWIHCWILRTVEVIRKLLNVAERTNDSKPSERVSTSRNLHFDLFCVLTKKHMSTGWWKVKIISSYRDGKLNTKFEQLTTRTTD